MYFQNCPELIAHANVGAPHSPSHAQDCWVRQDLGRKHYQLRARTSSGLLTGSRQNHYRSRENPWSRPTGATGSPSCDIMVIP